MWPYKQILCIFCCIFFLHACESKPQLRDTAQDVLDEHSQLSLTLRPDFSWSAFLRFWHRGADPRVNIEKAKAVENGYYLEYSHGVSLFVHMKNELVSGVSVSFLARPENNDGGQQFMRLMQHMQLQGTFRWTKEQRQHLFMYYDKMTQEKKEFIYKNSYFLRDYAAPVWTFHWIFVQDVASVFLAP